MIEFLQDYVTKAAPPEVFAKGQQVTRSPESELYFVGRGLAGYVIDGQLVDQDYQPIVVAQPEASDAATVMGRAGELALGDGTPQRASSGPRVAVTSDSLTAEQRDALSRALAERGLLEASVRERDASIVTLNDRIADITTQLSGNADRANETIADRDREIERLTNAAADAEKVAADLVAAQEEIARLTAELSDANAEGDDAAKKVEALAAEIDDLKQQLSAQPAAKVRGK